MYDYNHKLSLAQKLGLVEAPERPLSIEVILYQKLFYFNDFMIVMAIGGRNIFKKK